MKDATIIRMAEETAVALRDAHAFQETTHMAPTYNAMLQAARANHPDDLFLNTLVAINTDSDGISIAELRALLAQLRIALESLKDET